MRKSFFAILTICLVTHLQAQQNVASLEKKLATYSTQLENLRTEHVSHRTMPSIPFYLFGMGDRTKMIYKSGNLLNAVTGDTLYQWKVKKELIVPSEYYVYILTNSGKEVYLYENEKGAFLKEGKKVTPLSLSTLHLPDFKTNKYSEVLKVLHHEILINVINGKPVPNFFVYEKPWYRDAALMGMVLKATGNLHLIKDWVMNIRDPFDLNNHGMSEADNPGEVLFLVSLVSDKTHPVVKTIQDSTIQFIKQDKGITYLEGPTDYSKHPVFQTKWIKYGLKSLHMADTFNIPKMYDSYSSLFWWDYKDAHVDGAHFDAGSSENYPYLVWAEDHFYGEQKGMVTENILYPLSWEGKASDATYPGMKRVDEVYVSEKLSPPHTWHAAEMFLLLNEGK